MVASRQVEAPFYESFGRQGELGFGALSQVIGSTAYPFLRKYIVRAAKRVGADLLEFDSPEIAEVPSGRKNLNAAAKSVGRQSLRKQLIIGIRKRTASRVFLRRSDKPNSLSQSDIFTNSSYLSCQAVFGTNFLWQFLEILAVKSQQLLKYCRPTNTKLILLTHLMKIA